MAMSAFGGPYPPPPPHCRRVRKLLKTKGTKMGNRAFCDKNAQASTGEVASGSDPVGVNE
jgi:hypothetical protein